MGINKCFSQPHDNKLGRLEVSSRNYDIGESTPLGHAPLKINQQSILFNSHVTFKPCFDIKKILMRFLGFFKFSLKQFDTLNYSIYRFNKFEMWINLTTNYQKKLQKLPKASNFWKTNWQKQMRLFQTSLGTSKDLRKT